MLRIFVVVLLIGFAIAKHNASCRICKAKTPTNCAEAVKYHNCYGKLTIKLKCEKKPILVECVPHPDDLPGEETEPWLIVLRREWGDTSFARKWDDYKDGFGSIFDDFFIGLEKLHELTNAAENELWVQLVDWDDNKRWIKYDKFVIDTEDNKYKIKKLGKNTGIVPDSLRRHVGVKFSAIDKDNDIVPKINCAQLQTTGWWFRTCVITSNLNGLYFKGKMAEKVPFGVLWQDFRGFRYSLKYAHFAIRPRTLDD